MRAYDTPKRRQAKYSPVSATLELSPRGRGSGQGRIRTAEGVCQLIYSQPRLSTSVPAQARLLVNRSVRLSLLGEKAHRLAGQQADDGT